MASHNTTIRLELALLLLLATLWGASYSFIKVAIETIPPLTLIAARTMIAGALLLAVMRWRGVRLPRDVASWGRFAVQAGLNAVVPFTLIAWAEHTVDAGVAVILNATTPIFAFLVTALITRHEPVTMRKLVGVTLGIAGVCVIIGPEALSGLGHETGAQLAVVTASLCFAGAAIFGRNFQGLDPMVPAAGSLFCGRPAVDADAVICGRLCAPRLGGFLDSACLRDLFPAGEYAWFGRNHGAGLSAGADRRGNRCAVSRREPDGKRLDRPLLRGGRRGGDDHAIAPACLGGMRPESRRGLAQSIPSAGVIRRPPAVRHANAG